MSLKGAVKKEGKGQGARGKGQGAIPMAYRLWPIAHRLSSIVTLSLLVGMRLLMRLY